MSKEEIKDMFSLDKALGWIFAAILALLTWNVYTTHTLAISVGIIEERTANYKPGLTEQRVERLEKSIDALTNRLNSLEMGR